MAEQYLVWRITFLHHIRVNSSVKKSAESLINPKSLRKIIWKMGNAYALYSKPGKQAAHIIKLKKQKKNSDKSTQKCLLYIVLS